MKLFLILLISLITFSCKIQNVTQGSDENYFPGKWIGKFEGMLEWYTDKAVIKIPISMEIKKTESANELIWITSYDSTEIYPYKTVKDYVLNYHDSLGKGNFIIDEKNGIFIDVKQIGNTLYSSYEVFSENKEVSSRIVVTDKLINNDEIYHEIISFPAPDRKSGNIGTSKGYTIYSTNNISSQKAILKRVK